MGTPLAPAKIKEGDKIKDYQVMKKLGEGSCGVVYLVQNLKIRGHEGRAAVKVEPFMKCKDDEILKMEVYVLKKLQKSKHACRLLLAGKEKNYSYLVMSLLGKDLTELRRRYTDRKMPHSISLKVGLQALQAIQDVHSIGFVHRDIKPTNFAMSATNKGTLYIFDFGLARQIFIVENGKMKLREARNKVSFRGTVRYCSVNVHNYKEQGRHDDLWSWLYMLIELVTGTLPWKGMARKDSGQLKESVPATQLCQGCPQSFTDINATLKKLTYQDEPGYSNFRDWLKKDLGLTKTKGTESIDMDNVSKKKTQADDDKAEQHRDKDEKAEIDQMPDTDTHKSVDESVDSAATDQESQTHGFAKEDTLENCADIKDKDKDKEGNTK